MAKVLIIRELSSEANDALELYKRQHGLRSNTDAAEAMMKHYHALVSDRDHWKKCYLNADGQLTRIRTAHQKHLQAQDDLERILQGQETKSEEAIRKRKEEEDARFELRSKELARQRQEVLARVVHRDVHGEEE